MKTIVHLVITVMLLTAIGCASVPSRDEKIAEAIANPTRTEAHRERDARSKPEIVLGLLDLKPGQNAADIFGGGGYYAELMAVMVGPTGSVILHNNTPYSKFVEKQNKARYIDNTVPGITLLKSEVDDLKLTPDSLDAVLMVMSYHDLYFFAPERGWNETDVPLFVRQVHEALKPGGKLLIVDHAAAVGSGNTAPQDIHRIDEEYAKQDITSQGFRLVATSDALRNPDDDRTKMVFDKSIRGQTDRFVLLFEKE